MGFLSENISDLKLKQNTSILLRVLP